MRAVTFIYVRLIQFGSVHVS